METEKLGGFRDLESIYSSLITDIKSGGPLWEDVIAKGGKLFTALRATVIASNAFLDAIQKLADLASRSTGGSKEIGAHFTRLCMRQKRLGTKVKSMGNQLITSVVHPLTGRMDDWKKTLLQIEKEHSRETKRARAEFKRALAETNRLKRKLAKQNNTGGLQGRQSQGFSTIGPGVGLGEPPMPTRSISSGSAVGVGTSSLAVRTAAAVKVLEERVRQLDDLERASIKRLMLEERGRYCFLFSCMRPVLETELSLIGEVSTLRELICALSEATEDPTRLLEEAESILSHAGRGKSASIGGGGVGGVGIGANRPLSATTNEIEAFASAVDAIMSRRQTARREQARGDDGTPSVVSTCSSWSGAGGTQVNTSPNPSNNASLQESSNGSVFSSSQSMACTSVLSHTRLQQPANGPRSASVGRPTIVNVAGVGDGLVFPHPTLNGVRQRPLTSTSTTLDPILASPSRFSVISPPVNNNNNPENVTPTRRHSTCTLQQLTEETREALVRDDVFIEEEKPTKQEGVAEEEEEEEEETASGTLDDEISDDATHSDDHRIANGGGGGGRNTITGSGEFRRPSLANLLSFSRRSLSRGRDLQTQLYPDQALPPPVYTNLNRLTHAAQRKFSMSTTVSPSALTPTPTTCPEITTWNLVNQPQQSQANGGGDDLSIASAPHAGGGVYSVPASPHRPSFSTSSSNSRPRGSSLGLEDPFSVEVDQLDRMVTGSSAASSVTSRSVRSGTCQTSTGIPVGLLRASRSPDVNSLKRSRSRSSSFCASLASALLENPVYPAQCTETNSNWGSQEQYTQQKSSLANASTQVSTASSLLNQLSGQLQQLGGSSMKSGSAENRVEAPTEFDLPAPPSPDLLDDR